MPLLRVARNLSLTGVAVGFSVVSLACATTRVMPLWDYLNATRRAEHASLNLRDASFYYVSPSCLLAAARTIPVTASYGVVVGDVPRTSDVVKQAVRRAFQYWLLPRIYGAPQDVAWIVTYHESSEHLPVSYTNETGLCADSNVVRVTGP